MTGDRVARVYIYSNPVEIFTIGGLNVSLRNRMFIDADAWKFALNAVYGNTRFRILIKGTCDELALRVCSNNLRKEEKRRSNDG